MKSIIVLPFLLIAVVSGTLVHLNNNNLSGIDKKIDQLKAGLADVEKAIPTGTNIAFRPVDVGTDPIFFSRYLLAPRYCSIHPQEKLDTLLYMFPVNAADTQVYRMVGAAKMLLLCRDDQYQYFLVSNRR